MGDGYEVDVEQIRTHATNVDALRARFDAVMSASAHIAQDDSAYGLLCGWISGILEGRHAEQDDLFTYAQENLALAVQSLNDTATDYQNLDNQAAKGFGTVEGQLPR